ncbi:peptidase M23 [Frigidibacter albus]|uniref:M23 family peptidase n=1 Tax=Frigidibacter mobilis TaxID=1335048 RepID=A0A165SF00_9RHOB|nr:peptidoglycan DD-metalloendopeptidase family protein [Frigidibacter mobilis]AMY67393.1 M23 family peptidase [Frigidibacter mobilis]
MAPTGYVLLAAALGLAAPALAQEAELSAAARGAPPRPVTVAQDAVTAADELRSAISALRRAGTGREQVAALSQTIRAYETGLASLRGGLRKAALREAEIAADLEARRDRLSRLLGAMMTMQSSPAPLTLLHPDGPEAAVRAGMILSDVTPALQDEASMLSRDLEEVAQIRALQEGAVELLSSGLTAAQEARTALSQAMQDRTDLPRRFLEDPEELQALLTSADTLEAFTLGIVGMEQDIGPPMEDFAGAQGSLPLPVLGTVLRGAGQADAAGIRRPGLLIATRPAALVTTPWPATIRYRGPLLDYGNVMILEPAEGYLLVLAGLGTVYGSTGDVLEAGAPVGLMGGAEPGGQEFLAAAQEGGGADRTETLYIELRQGKKPVDPAAWFTETKED